MKSTDKLITIKKGVNLGDFTVKLGFAFVLGWVGYSAIGISVPIVMIGIIAFGTYLNRYVTK